MSILHTGRHCENMICY